MAFDQSSDGFYQTNYGHGGGQYYEQHQGYGQQGNQYEYGQPQGYGGGYGHAPMVPDPSLSHRQGAYTGQIMHPQVSGEPLNDTYDGGFEDEPPLLEELGINFDHIWKKTLAVLNPFTNTDSSIINETDLAGPFCFCLALGGTLLLGGKVSFGYIYGIGGLGVAALYTLLNLMAINGVSVGCVASVVGYCILPMVLLSSFSLVLSLKGLLGIILTFLTVGWCSLSASKLFVCGLNMESQQLLIAYPCAMLYGVFALLTVF